MVVELESALQGEVEGLVGLQLSGFCAVFYALFYFSELKPSYRAVTKVCCVLGV